MGKMKTSTYLIYLVHFGKQWKTFRDIYQFLPGLQAEYRKYLV